MSKSRPKTYLSLRDSLILNFLIFGVVIILIIGAFSYYTAKEILLDRTFEQLTSVKVMKTRQVEAFFADRGRDASFIASFPETLQLLELLNAAPGPGNRSGEVARIYGNYLAGYLAARDYYRSFYIFSDKGHGLKIPTGSYAAGNETIMHIGEVSVLEKLWVETRAKKRLAFADLDKNMSDPGLFIGIPLATADGENGMLAMEIALEAINKIMLENNPYEGLGESGESYLVGSDLLMRSISRFRDNSILNTKVETEGVRQALLGADSIALINDYRGIEVLSSFGQVDIPELNWVLLAEIDLSEALVPLRSIRNNILLISSFIVLLLFIAAVILSNKITSPIIKLKNAAEHIGRGEFNTRLQNNSGNEIGDLTNSFNIMAAKLEEKTLELEGERAKRLRSVLDGQELERQRLSRELHDGLGQRIIALKLKLENVNASEQCDTMGMLREIKVNFDETIDEIRRMSNNLMPAVLHEFGLPTALRNLLDGLSDHSQIKGSFTVEGKYDDLDKITKTYLYRIAQEGINNAVKHADASHVLLKIERSAATIRLIIEDDGRGFDPRKMHACDGNGLFNMRERTELLNGQIVIKARPGKGTVIRVVINENNAS